MCYNSDVPVGEIGYLEITIDKHQEICGAVNYV